MTQLKQLLVFCVGLMGIGLVFVALIRFGWCKSWDITVLPSPDGQYTFYETGTTCGAGSGWIDLSIRPAGFWPFSWRHEFGVHRPSQLTWRWEDKGTLVATTWRGTNAKPSVTPDRSGRLVVTPPLPPPDWCGSKVVSDVLVRCDEQDGDPPPREWHGP